MSFFEQVYQKLFNRPVTGKKAILHEPIVRSELFIERYEEFKKSKRFKDLLKSTRESYLSKLSGHQQEPVIHLLKSEYSNGLAISHHELITNDDFLYLFDWLAEKVEKLGYRKINCDVVMTDMGDFIETKEKYFLKPERTNDIPNIQRYGNILIEYTLIDENPSYIKVMANVYNDRLYSKPEEFDKLAEYLLENKMNPIEFNN